MAQQSNGGGEKTEKPTAKKLADAAKEGDILQSRELGTGLVVMAGAVWLAIAGPMLVDALRTMLVEGLRFDQRDVVEFDPALRGAGLASGLLLPVGGLMLATVVAAIAAPALLGSLGFRSNAFMPKASKINPANGLKRMFGMQGLIELGKSLAKVALMGAIGVWLVWSRLTEITVMGTRGLETATAELGSLFVLACLVMGGALLLIAGVDVPAQLFQRAKRLGMSKQDIKDEHKESEGSPEVKGQMRRRQYETLQGSARKAVAEATVVLTNPTHFAVALRYQPGRDMAPVVVARGCDAIAAAIRELADQNQVPVLQYPELARAVYFTSRNGQVVNEALYMAVATVLAFLFRVENRMASEMDRPHIELPPEMRFNADGKVEGA
ncbi:EscU/YscU/HrcU family type III secretion system export apparatus switch protein [Sphingobium subterraneum]|uniref:Flagellar biosynthetic protein FlhB n=1 Tax=Sphingobium subterraneum TaxID=627688 RepID=A0A841IXT8_9SPHN|nr:flagellar type III secretion system protein FlhB [Sphingobium subterraneum]MBB6123769.1 flagellar biosynthetic protein FlhB [Sphingobium subterraneum]